ncbi:MAG TPA: glutamine synthetase [Burkholderiales bacterium]|nr:glutamine synthetase [Burkholderiales bacterium]
MAMKPEHVKTVADAKKIVDERKLTHVKVGVFDIDGILRGKYMSREKFFGALDKGFGFCDVVLGWDLNDQLYDNVQFTGWHTGYPDAEVRLLPHTCREIPIEGDMLFFLGEFTEAAKAPCPRGVLRRVLAKAKKMGYEVYAGFEYEYFVFDETPDSVRAKHYRDLKPMAPGFFGYSVIRNTVHSDFYLETLELCEKMRFALEGLHEETGPGVLEAAIGYDEALESADKAGLFKTFIKAHAQLRGRMATFMAKWNANLPGQSGHMHVSLRKAGKPVFHDPRGRFGMSRTMEQFVAGQQAYMPEFLGMVASTVNAYTRMVPGYWAPTHATWGVENRTCALRVIPGSEKSQRVEYRISAADGNPYLALAAAVASGLLGIENKLTLGKPVTGNAYDQKPPARGGLPSTLWDAAQRLKASKAARECFGDAFVEHFAATREWEERQFRKSVTDWELDRYFEII